MDIELKDSLKDLLHRVCAVCAIELLVGLWNPLFLSEDHLSFFSSKLAVKTKTDDNFQVGVGKWS